MDNKKLIIFLIIVIVIAFSVGLLSFNYNDKDNFVGIIDNGIINIESGDEIVNIGTNGIEIHDGDDHVSIGWNGINISDGDEHVSIGWNGINVMEGGKTKFSFGKRRNFFSFRSPKFISHSIDEEQFEAINNINNISISSSFVNIKVTSEDRDDIRIHYHGNLKSNVLPKLKVEKTSNNIDIKLETPNVSSQVTTHSDVVLEVFVPKSFKGDFNTSSSSGNVEIKLPQDANYNIKGSSSSGRYTSNVDMNIIENEKGRFNAIIGSGENSIDIITSSGNVKINNN